MRVLVTEQRPGDATEVAARLGAAGQQLAYCHGPTDGTALCADLATGGRCPLAGLDVDVVVDARATDGAPTPRETGVLCALRHGTPLVVTGPLPASGAAPWRAADVRCHPEDVVAACRRAATVAGPTVHRVVSRAVRAALRHTPYAQAPLLAVYQRGGAFEVFVTTDGSLPGAVRDDLRLVVRVALVPYTAYWQRVPVTFLTSGFTWPAQPVTAAAPAGLAGVR